MTTKLTHCFIEDNISKVIWRYSFPMLGAILALLVYDILESSLLAYANSEYLVSLGFTLPITTAMTALAIASSIRCNNKVVKCASLLKQDVGETISTSLLMSFIFIVLFSVLAIFFNAELLTLLGNDLAELSVNPSSFSQLTGSAVNTPELTSVIGHIEQPLFQHSVVQDQTHYMTMRYVSWVFLAIIWQVNAILRALGNCSLASKIMFFWLVVKSLLAIAILSPESDFHISGLVGIGLVHSISDTFFAVLSLSLLIKFLPLKLPKLSHCLSHLRQPKTDSLLIVIQQLITPLSMAILTLIAANINTSYVGAFALLFRLEALFLLLPMVLTTSAPAIVGSNYWSGQQLRVRKAYQIIFISVVVVQLLIAINISLQADFLVALVCPETSMAEHLKNYLLWVPWGYIGAGCAIVYQSCLNAKGQTKYATFIGVLHRIFLVLPFAYIGSVFMENAADTTFGLTSFSSSTTGSNYFFQGIMLGHLLAGLGVFWLYTKVNIQLKKTRTDTKSTLESTTKSSVNLSSS